MEGALKVLLFAALILLVTAQTFNNYRSLPAIYQKHIDKALKEANSKFGGDYHVAFHSLEGTPKTMESNLYVNVLLIVTTCKKASKDPYKHRDECVTRKEQTHWIDCLVCKSNDNEELVDCARRKDAYKGKSKDIRNNCKPLYHIGGGTMMMQESKDNVKKPVCLGCI